MLLYAKYLINIISPSVIIKSQDTDVFILSLAVCKKLPSIYSLGVVIMVSS